MVMLGSIFDTARIIRCLIVSAFSLFACNKLALMAMRTSLVNTSGKEATSQQAKKCQHGTLRRY